MKALQSLYFVASLFLCNCDLSPNVLSESLPGSYKGNSAQHIEVLTIYPDNRYIYYFSNNASQEIHNAGTWEYEQHISKPGVTFNNFVFGHSDYGTKRMPSFWNVEIQTTWLGKIQLCIDEDIDYCLIKRQEEVISAHSEDKTISGR